MAGEPLSRSLTRADVTSARQVAELLDIPKSTIEDWARRGMVPSRKRGRRRLFLRWEIEAWLVSDDDQRQAPRGTRAGTPRPPVGGQRSA